MCVVCVSLCTCVLCAVCVCVLCVCVCVCVCVRVRMFDQSGAGQEPRISTCAPCMSSALLGRVSGHWPLDYGPE